MPTDRLTELEIKLSYQDDLIETLNQAVIDVRNQVAQLRKRVVELEERQPQGQADGFRHEPPPHY